MNPPHTGTDLWEFSSVRMAARGTWTKDAAGRVVISAYDVLGRAAGTWSAPPSADLTSTTADSSSGVLAS
ncbi:hypothetical protein [Streptomyces cavernae]|uniref:hypothetical protein n=1 Tax=Streptomyces cavernae TaxID=2259034 RepID=UPI000FEBCEA8|nr:hypothetical protein [Streptomyces cavernae]